MVKIRDAAAACRTFLLVQLLFLVESTLAAFQQEGGRVRMTTTQPVPSSTTSPKQKPAKSTMTTTIAKEKTQRRSTIKIPPNRLRRGTGPPFPNGPNGGRVVTLAGLFDSNPLLPSRDVQVWLPPEYSSSGSCSSTSKERRRSRRFPVLYCHDGQNVMNDANSWTGASWRLPGALVELSRQGLLHDSIPGPPICVMIPSAEGEFLPGMLRRRHLEYASALTIPFAQAHADVVATKIKPLIDSTFRTDPSHTSAIGSSMGGQASMNLLLRHPDLFQAAACLSPYFAPDTLAAVGLLASQDRKKQLESKRIYLDIGGDVDDTKVPMIDVMDHLTPQHWWNPGYFWLDTSLQPGVQAMRRALQLAGCNRNDDDSLHFEQYPGGRHNERAWSNRIHKPLLYLYGRRQDDDDDDESI